MTILLDKVTRDGLGIDTVARGIVYACHLLKPLAPNEIKLGLAEDLITSTTLNTDTNTSTETTALTGTITLEVTLYYDRTTFYGSGSNLTLGIAILSNKDVVDNIPILESASSGITMPEDNFPVNNLETYLAWLIVEYKKDSLSSDPINLEKVKITQGETGDKFYKKYTIKINYNPVVYFETNNLIQAVDA